MCAHHDSSESNSGLWFGAVVGELARRGRDKLTFLISPPIESFGLWAEQLVAEAAGHPIVTLSAHGSADNTARVLASGSVPRVAVAGDSELRALLADATPPHYVAIMGYLPPSDGLDAAIASLRTAIRAATGAATTFGYGPLTNRITAILEGS